MLLIAALMGATMVGLLATVLWDFTCKPTGDSESFEIIHDPCITWVGTIESLIFGVVTDVAHPEHLACTALHHT